MKTKKVILGALVFIFAAGTAFASLYQNDRFVSVEVETDGNCFNPEEKCLEINPNPDCNEMQGFPCTVDVEITANGGGTEEATVFEDAGCNDELNHSQAGPIDIVNVGPDVCGVVQ